MSYIDVSESVNILTFKVSQGRNIYWTTLVGLLLYVLDCRESSILNLITNVEDVQTVANDYL